MIPFVNAWQDDFERPPDIQAEDGGTWKNPDGSYTSIVQLAKSHWWNNGWIPTDLRLQETPDGKFVRPDLGVVAKDGLLMRGAERYQPIAVGTIDKGRRIVLHTPDFWYVEGNKHIWQLGPFKWITEFSSEGWRDYLLLTEKPDLGGSDLYIEFYSNIGLIKKPFAYDARANVLDLCWSQFDDSIRITVPNYWLDEATYPAEIDPSPILTDGCRTGGSEFASYVNAGLQTKWWCDFSPSFAWVGQDALGFYYRRFRYQLCFKLQQFCCTEILSAYMRLSGFGFACDFSSTNFDIEIQKYDWSAYEQTATCLGQCDDSGGPDSATCNALHAGQPAAAVDVTWRNTSGLVCDTYYNSPALDVNWINNDKGGCGQCVYYGIISDRDRSATSPTGPEYVSMATRSGARPASLVFTWYPCGPHPQVV